MNGRPVWLASVSYKNRLGRTVPTGNWSPDVRARAEDLLLALLGGVGDEDREVLFRMNVTLCRHRGLSDAEEAGLPEDFHCFQATDTAGASVELVWRKGTSSKAVEPCANPGREYVDAHDPRLWVPVPCETCPSCVARAACRASAL